MSIVAKLLPLMVDVIREQIRSRILYIYLVTMVVAITAIAMSTVFNRDERDEAQWFSELMDQSAEVHLQRLRSASQETSDFPDQLGLPPAQADYIVAETYRLVVTEVFPEIPLWCLELPAVERCVLTLVARGGMIEERPGELGVTNYMVSLINAYIEHHPEEWPFLDHSVSMTPDGVMVSLSCLPEHFSASLNSIVRLVLNPPLEPSERFFRDLFDIKTALDGRRVTPLPVAYDLVCNKLFRGHRFAESQLGAFSDLQSKQRQDLEASMERLFSPGRMGLVVAGPLACETIEKHVRDNLLSFSVRQRQPPLERPVMEDPEHGLFKERLASTNKASCVAGMMFGTPEHGKIDERFFQLLVKLREGYDWKLRKNGLIYSGEQRSLFPTEQHVAVLSLYMTSAHKATEMIRNLSDWLLGFPASVSDDELETALNALRAIDTQIMANPEYAVHHMVHGMFLRDLEAKDFLVKARSWKEMSIADARVLLQTADTTKTIAIGTVQPPFGGLP